MHILPMFIYMTINNIYLSLILKTSSRLIPQLSPDHNVSVIFFHFKILQYRS